jgi:hypothetical protein
LLAAETYTELVTNVPHIFFELTWEAISGIIFYPIGKRIAERFGARIHREIDAEHNVVHDGGTNASTQNRFRFRKRNRQDNCV